MSELVFTEYFWFGLAVILFILELLLGTNFFLLSLGAVSTIVGVIVWFFPQLIGDYQLLLFAIGSILSVGIWWIYCKNHSATKPTSTLNRRAEQYIGRTCPLSEPIVNGRGKIRVDDSTWQVEGPDLPMGSVVEVIGVEGVILKVKKHE